MSASVCHGCGPGYASPADAFRNGAREKIVYVAIIHTGNDKPDGLATVDVDPESATFCQVLNVLPFLHVGDEAHHYGWNSCSSCYGQPTAKRTHLIVPCLNSSRIYIVNVSKDPRAPFIDKVIEPEELFKHDVSFLHTVHCLADGRIMMSSLGDAAGNAKGNFLLLKDNFEIDKKWSSNDVPFGYDFWYQPRHNVMISSEWGVPKLIKKGFNVGDVANGQYGTKLHVWDWKEHKLIDQIELGPDGCMSLELRMFHNPESLHGFCGAALGATVFHFYRNEVGKWLAHPVIKIPSKQVTGWALENMPSILSDILISMNDKFLYFSNWVHGDIRQYDVSDPFHPKLTGQLFIGGSILSDSGVKVTKDEDLQKQPDPVYVKGVRIQGGPQMLQLSLDGKRLYVTTSLYKPWDAQFYPKLLEHGGVMLQVDCDSVNGGMKLNENFLADFGKLEGGPYLAHEVRYPGGDCTSDIWL